MQGHRRTQQRSGEPRPALNWRAVAGRVRLQIVDRNIALLAAGTAFWAILSIFPAIIAMVTIYGLVASPEQVTTEVTKLGGSLSPSTREVVTNWLAGLTNTSHQQLGVGLVVGLVAVLWALSSGVRTLIKAITAAYEQEETRGYFKLRGIALLTSIGVIVVAVIALGAIGLAPAIRHLVHNAVWRIAFDVGEWVVLAVILTAAVAALYWLAPPKTSVNWRWASAGAVFSTVFVVLASVGFSFYVRFFAHYNKTYGTLGGIVILMLWLYYCVFIVLLGALIDIEAEREMTGNVSAAAEVPATAG
ncbi:MAG TPA: YihY/virulence factor BrkB family protein [Acidothermaceae bacterium]|nr:YihY/virulence factor BrkB family protein [Acidothermaceae bacterium]